MELLKLFIYAFLCVVMLYNAFYFAYLMTKKHGARWLKIKTALFAGAGLLAIFAVSLFL